MKSVANIRLLLTLISVIIPLLVQPVSSRRESHHRDEGNHESVKASHHRKDRSDKENGHKKQSTDDELQKPTAGHPLNTPEVLNHQSLGFSPVCSWCHSVHFDPDRLPKVLPIASCCSTDLNITRVRGLPNVRCETIYYDLLVKLRNKDQTEDSSSWEERWLRVPAGCTPAKPVAQKQKRRKDPSDGKARSRKKPSLAPKTKDNSA